MSLTEPDVKRVIIGYGNTLRGEDAFGVDVLRVLQKISLKQTKLLEAFQLTPEIVLELVDADEVVFIDAAYNEFHHYVLACHLNRESRSNLTHQMTPQMIMSMLKSLYGCDAVFEICSMFTCRFDTIGDQEQYTNTIQKVCDFYSLSEGVGLGVK